MALTPTPPFNPNQGPRPGGSVGGGSLPPGWGLQRPPRHTSEVIPPNSGQDQGQAPPPPAGLSVPQPGQVGGPWGGTMYPEWFQSGIGPNMSPEHAANLFADFVSQNPTMDFGWYWNQFKPSSAGGSMIGDRGIRFGSGQPGQPGENTSETVSGNAPTTGTTQTMGDGNQTNQMAAGGQQQGAVQAPPQANRNSVQRPQSQQTQQATAKQPPVQVIVQSGGGQQATAPAPSFSNAAGVRPGGAARLGAQPMRAQGQAPQTSLQRPPNTGLGVSPGNPTPQRRRPGGIGSNY